VSTIKTPENQGAIKTGKFHGVNRFEVSLDYLPQPDFLEFSLPDTHHALITNDGSALTQQVITSLKKDGNKVVVLNLPNIANPIAENAVNIATATDVAIGEAIQNVRTQYGKTGTFIHLHPHFEFQNGCSACRSL